MEKLASSSTNTSTQIANELKSRLQANSNGGKELKVAVVKDPENGKKWLNDVKRNSLAATGWAQDVYEYINNGKEIGRKKTTIGCAVSFHYNPLISPFSPIPLVQPRFQENLVLFKADQNKKLPDVVYIDPGSVTIQSPPR